MTDGLETAARREGLRRVAIDPVSRVEGHGKVTILLDDANRVQQVRLHIVEFRGFEKFIEGRPYWEVPVMVQRLCGICPVSHHLAASKAMDRVIGAHPAPPTATKIRRLMHYGQVLQSHALHFFHLSSPDLLFGFDSEVQQRNIVGVIAKHPDIAKKGVLLRKFGQEVIRVTAGKRVHGTGSIPGGMNRHVSREDRDMLQRDIAQTLAWAEDAVTIAKQLHAANRELYDAFGSFRSKMLSLVRPDGALELYDGVLRARDESGAILVDGAADQGYRGLIEEETKPWTYMKFPHLRALGREAGWYRVGPLARVAAADFLSTELANQERTEMMAVGGGRPPHGTLLYHWARLIEALHSAELIRDLLDDPEILGSDLLADFGPRQEGMREGVGVIEAPRGTLFHHYRVGEDDLVKFCNLIVSTTNNNQAMNEAIRHVARTFFDGREVTEGLLNHIEVAIRAYDPCLSCATHALGKMPLEVDLVDADGTLVSRRRRNLEGVA